MYGFIKEKVLLSTDIDWILTVPLQIIEFYLILSVATKIPINIFKTSWCKYTYDCIWIFRRK